MCGIAGRLNFDPAQPVEASLIRRMNAVLAHRGPDDEGVWTSGPVGLGHRRLSVIDLSPAGHQPMSSTDGALWIVFNGEIYNFRELRRDLGRSGHAFRSRTDTEVILALYEREGVDCLRRLQGMFAFAIWDERARRLFLARDRLGVKPLVYHADATGITFASEIKALLQDPHVPRRPDPDAIHHYLTYQSVPAPWSAFEGIRKLPPGHFLVSRDGAFEVKRYWSLSYRPKLLVASPRARRALEVELIERFEEAVRLRLVSDVPLGAFLSGGVDSSAVVAMMTRHSTGPVRTFSIGFDDRAYDEGAHARLVARRFGTLHTELTVRPDALEVLPRLAWHYDEPYADASAIPTYYLSRLAREHVTVVLNGDGGDENFAGYDRYVANELARRLGPVAPVLGGAPSRALIRWLSRGAHPASARWRLRRFVEALALPPAERNATWMSQFDNATKRRLYSSEFSAALNGRDAQQLFLERFHEADADDFTDAALAADVSTYLPDTLLVKVDIASMANRLETRSPFLDHEFMEFAARIPSNLKIRGSQTKRILKQALRGIVPDPILDRSKMGFSVPVERWLREDLREMSRDLLLSPRSRARGYFEPRQVERLLHEHDRGIANRHSQIWTLMMLELWHRTFIDAPPVPERSTPTNGEGAGLAQVLDRGGRNGIHERAGIDQKIVEHGSRSASASAEVRPVAGEQHTPAVG